MIKKIPHCREHIVGKGSSIKSDGVKLDLWAQSSICNKLNTI